MGRAEVNGLAAEPYTSEIEPDSGRFLELVVGVLLVVEDGVERR